MHFGKVVAVVAAVVWVACVGAGMWELNAYEALAGTVAPRPAVWPQLHTIAADTSRPTLIMAVHPQCPCTRASLSNLARVLAQSHRPVRTLILFVIPPGVSPGWEKTDLWSIASSLPNTEVRRDPGGAEADRLGAETSGQCYLFAADGRRLFSGGITESRGHEGDSAGSDALVDLIDRGASRTAQTSVFGCPLSAPAARRVSGARQ